MQIEIDQSDKVKLPNNNRLCWQGEENNLLVLLTEHECQLWQFQYNTLNEREDFLKNFLTDPYTMVYDFICFPKKERIWKLQKCMNPLK